MKRTLIALAGLLVVASCEDADRTKSGEPENDTNAAREFIRAALDGNYDKARTFLVNDSLNQQDLSASERLYNERMTKEEKEKYRGAAVHIHERKVLDSATSIIYFSNSYRNQKDSLKVVKTGDKWLVDFKYIFKHKPDSLR